MAEQTPGIIDSVQTPAIILRSGMHAGRQEGVLDAGDFAVSVGAGRSVNVAAGEGMVRGDAVARQGLYYVTSNAVKNSDNFEGGGIPAPDALNPRIDQVIARVYDPPGTRPGTLHWRFEILAGTPSAAAQITDPAGASYRAGAAALPATAMRIADLHVSTAGVVTVVDRRPRAYGAHLILDVTADRTTASLSYGAISGLAASLELSGAPLEVTLMADAKNDTSAQMAAFRMYRNGVGVGSERRSLLTTVDDALSVSFFIPAITAGRAALDMRWLTFGGTARLVGTASRLIQWRVREVLQPNAAN